MLIFDRGNDSNLHRILILVDVQRVGDTAQLNTYSNLYNVQVKKGIFYLHFIYCIKLHVMKNLTSPDQVSFLIHIAIK